MRKSLEEKLNNKDQIPWLIWLLDKLIADGGRCTGQRCYSPRYGRCPYLAYNNGILRCRKPSLDEIRRDLYDIQFRQSTEEIIEGEQYE
jgi:hypothetical protein